MCHASVVFGLGKELYKTLTVESNEPQWKEEAIVYVVNIPVSFTLTHTVEHLIFSLLLLFT